jgi:hypothetical protein
MEFKNLAELYDFIDEEAKRKPACLRDTQPDP